MSVSRTRRIVTASVALLLAACATPDGRPIGSRVPEEGAPQDSQATAHDIGAMPDRPLTIPEPIWGAIEEQLSDPGNVMNAPTIVAAEAVTWNDGSLGCPHPGQVYTQALVPGYRVVLEVEGEELNFHASESGQVILCEKPRGGSADT